MIRRATMAAVAVALTLGPAGARAADPTLEPGFPARAYAGGGTYSGGPGVGVGVADVDRDPELEIFASAQAEGPLMGWNADGSELPGWPVRDSPGHSWFTFGDFSRKSPAMELFAATFRGDTGAFSGEGRRLPGWPRDTFYDDRTVSAADVDGDGLDEVFFGASSGLLVAYRADGRVLKGWEEGRAHPGLAGEIEAAAFGDLDGDGRLD